MTLYFFSVLATCLVSAGDVDASANCDGPPDPGSMAPIKKVEDRRWKAFAFFRPGASGAASPDALADAKNDPSLWQKADLRATQVRERMRSMGRATLNRIETVLDGYWVDCVILPAWVAGCIVTGAHGSLSFPQSGQVWPGS
jgi:hypothetical protein